MLRAIEADLGPLNFGLATAWRKATTRDEWRHCEVNTATLQRSTLWKKKERRRGLCGHCGVFVIRSVSVQDYCKSKSADVMETWCYDWIYQSEELSNFWKWSGPECGFWVTFPSHHFLIYFDSPLRNILGDLLAFLTQSRHSATRLTDAYKVMFP